MFPELHRIVVKSGGKGDGAGGIVRFIFAGGAPVRIAADGLMILRDHAIVKDSGIAG